MVLDRVDEAQSRRDRAAVRAVLTKHAADVSYGHAAVWEHPGIQVADVIAWAYGAGGEWRRRILPIVHRVRELNI